MDVAFHASFESEEGRRPGFRLILYSQKDHNNWIKRRLTDTKYFHNHFRIVPLDFPRPFSVAEINRIAPAAEMKRLLICVSIAESVRGRAELQIWALLDTGENWWKFVHHEASGGYPPPKFLTITSTSPGEMSLSSEGDVLAILRSGQIFRPTAEALLSGGLSDFLESARKRLYDATIAMLEVKKYSRDDNDYPQRFYNFFLERVLFYTRQRGHGGSILMIPTYLAKEDTRLTDRITIKYSCDYDFAWAILTRILANHSRYFRSFFPLWDGKQKITKARFQEYHLLESEKEELEEALGDIAQSIASLTSVDGAVVVTDQFKVIGFGAEVIATSPSLTSVRILSNTKNPKMLPISSFGTRHRSAFRFCSSLEDSVAFVVSQDGGVRAVKRVGEDVILWPDINTGAMGI